MTPSSSRPKPAVPAASRMGFWKRRPKTVRERSAVATLTARDDAGSGRHRTEDRPAATAGAHRRDPAGGAARPAGRPGLLDRLRRGVRLERVLQHAVAADVFAPERRRGMGCRRTGCRAGLREASAQAGSSHRRPAAPSARRARPASRRRGGGTGPRPAAGVPSVSRADFRGEEQSEVAALAAPGATESGDLPDPRGAPGQDRRVGGGGAREFDLGDQRVGQGRELFGRPDVPQRLLQEVQPRPRGALRLTTDRGGLPEPRGRHGPCPSSSDGGHRRTAAVPAVPARRVPRR